MSPKRDSYCSYCGSAFVPPLAWPRTCAQCGVTIWANPVPVTITLVPLRVGERTGLLVVRRAIEPGIGRLALAGGFLEEHETWQEGAAREVREETGIAIDAGALVPFWFASSDPRPNRVLLFCVAPPIDTAGIAPWIRDHETMERGVVFGPQGLEEEFVFSLHVEAAKRWMAHEGLSGAHGFTAI